MIADYVCCPACKGKLSLIDVTQADRTTQSGTLECERCQVFYPINKGIPDLIWPRPLDEANRLLQSCYDSSSILYDREVTRLLASMGVPEACFRQNLVERLQLTKDARVLEVGVGTGSNLILMAKFVQDSAQLVGLDLSVGMLKECKAKCESRGLFPKLFLGNAEYLPFQTNSFDAVFHFGALNAFSNQKKAIEEMFRVAKPGAKLVLGDEGLAPEKRQSSIGQLLIRFNPLFSKMPPLSAIPSRDFKLEWLLGGSCYVIEARK